MKKLILAAAAGMVAGSASAADMAVKYRAPPPAPVYNWTGCYVGAGGGYGMWNQDQFAVATATGARITETVTAGGKGWFGTVQVGCDYQVSSSWVIGAFADYDFGNIRGNPHLPGGGGPFGDERERSSWAAGGRIGWLPMEKFLTYVSAGYTQARFNTVDLFVTATGAPTGTNIPSHTYSGWFLGTGYEYSLGWLPGLFWKTEYRYADYRSDLIDIVVTATGAPTGVSIDSHKYIQTVRSELVWRFNWGKGVVAKY
jgi:outer membrane immunogenic protein